MLSPVMTAGLILLNSQYSAESSSNLVFISLRKENLAAFKKMEVNLLMRLLLHRNK